MLLPHDPSHDLSLRQLLPILPPPVPPKPFSNTDCASSCIRTAISDIRAKNDRKDLNFLGSGAAAICTDPLGQAFYERCLSWAASVSCLRELEEVSGTTRSQFADNCPSAVKELQSSVTISPAPSIAQQPSSTSELISQTSTSPPIHTKTSTPSLSSTAFTTTILTQLPTTAHTTTHSATTTSVATSKAEDSSAPSTSNSGVVVGAGIAIGMLIVILIVIGMWVYWRRRHTRRWSASSTVNPLKSVDDDRESMGKEGRHRSLGSDSELLLIEAYMMDHEAAKHDLPSRPEKAMAAHKADRAEMHDRTSTLLQARTYNSICTDGSALLLTKTMRNWNATKWEEISVQEGERAMLWQACIDGWAFGLIWTDLSGDSARCGFFPSHTLQHSPATLSAESPSAANLLKFPARLLQLGGDHSHLFPKRDLCLRALASGLLSDLERKSWATELETINAKITVGRGAPGLPLRKEEKANDGQRKGDIGRIIFNRIRSSGQSSDSSISIPKDQW